MDYFVRDKYFYNEYKFFKEAFDSIELFLTRPKENLLKRFVEIYAIKRPNHFENSFLSNLYIFHNILYILKK